MYHLGAKAESVMESWTMTSPPLSGAKGADDGGRPEVGVPTGQSGVWNGASEAGSPSPASLFDEPVSAAAELRKAQKGAILGETKPLGGLE